MKTVSSITSFLNKKALIHHMELGNYFKTAALLALLTVLLLWVGSFWGTSGLTITIIFVGLMNFVSYFWSDKIVLFMYKAKPVSEKEAPRLYKITKSLSQKMGIPMPKVYIIPSTSPNAFATGRNPKHAAVAATEGILNLLDDEELTGVMAHEISHVTHRDILISTIAGTIAGVISYIGTMAQWGAIFGGRDEREGGNMVGLLIMAIVAPLAAMLIQLAISRSREYHADNGAAKLLKNGEGLASALSKLEKEISKNPLRFGSPATAHLFIANPFRGSGLLHLFSTHPPMQERVKRLKSMKF